MAMRMRLVLAVSFALALKSDLVPEPTFHHRYYRGYKPAVLFEEHPFGCIKPPTRAKGIAFAPFVDSPNQSELERHWLELHSMK